MATGNLIVHTRAARGAVPVSGAAVTVYGGDEIGIARTDQNGSTPPIELEAPSLEGVSPETVPPFAVYRVDIAHPDFRPVTVTNLAVFSGIVTSLPVDMVPPRTAAEQTQPILINSAETGPTGSGEASCR